MSQVEQVREIVQAATREFRKGEEVVEEGNVTHIYAMPHESERDEAQYEGVDLHFEIIGVDRAVAADRRDELVELLNAYPWDGPYRDGLPELKQGPSYIHLGAAIEDQGYALRLMALGEVLDLWQVITPERLGLKGPEADRMAGSGMVVITGYWPEGRTKKNEPAESQ